MHELDLLPEEVDAQELVVPSTHTDGPAPDEEESRVATTERPSNASSAAAMHRSTRSGRLGDLDWFEELIDGSRLGRTQKTRRGAGLSADGTTQVSWEISEYVEGEDGSGQTVTATSSSSKRKIGDVAEDDDVAMRQ